MPKNKKLPSPQNPKIVDRPITRLDSVPSPDEGRRILADLPDGEYTPGDLGRHDTRYFLAGMAVINEWTKEQDTQPQKRDVAFLAASGPTQVTRSLPPKASASSIHDPRIVIRDGVVTVEGKRFG